MPENFGIEHINRGTEEMNRLVVKVLGDIPPERQEQLRRQLAEMEEVRERFFPQTTTPLGPSKYTISQSDDDWSYRDEYNKPQ